MQPSSERRHFLRVAAISLCLSSILVAGCGDGGSPTPEPPTTPTTPTTVSPSITTQPANQVVTEPAVATFSVLAAGTPTPTYQWEFSTNGSTYNAIGGANSNSYTTGATALNESGYRFRVVITNSAGSVTSDPGILTVSAAPPALTPPAITTQPLAQLVAEPDSATFSVIATGNPAPTFQWQLSIDGNTYSTIGGATNNSYSTGATTTAQSGHRYRVIVTNSEGSDTSDSAQLSVNSVPSGATIIFSRNNGTVNIPNEDLYSIRERGGVEIPLATSSQNDGLCGVTPAGRVIFRTSVNGQNDIHSINADGTDLRVLADSSDNEVCASIVRSGAAAGRLIYHRHSTTNGTDIYAVNADGTVHTPLATGTNNESFVALTASNRVIFHSSTSFDTNVYSVDLEGLSVTPLATSPNYEGYYGDSAGIVVIGRDGFGQGDLYTVGELGVGFGVLSASPSLDESLAGISPGGALLIHTRDTTTNERKLYANSALLVTNSDGIGYVGSTATHVVYQSYTGNTPHPYAVRIDGTDNVQLGNSLDSEGAAFITNDGRLFYERYAITGATVTLGDIYLINLDGTNRLPLVTSPDHESFAALVGNKLLYRREIANSVNNIQLWSMNLDGSGNARVLTQGGQAYFSAVTPSGKVIVRHYTGTNFIHLANTDGSEQQLLVSNAVFQAVVP
jgi:hypothetical protein